MIKGSTARAAERVSIRSVLRGSEGAAPRVSRRRTRALVGWLLYCFTAVGGTAAAFTVRDTLFPALGAPTRPALWASNVDSTLSTEHGSSSTEGKESALEAITIPATTATTVAPSIEDQTVPTSSASGQGPDTSVDNRGPGGDGPATGTTVVGPSSGPGSGPGTTVDDHGTDTSTPASASTPTSADATPASASLPGPFDTSAGHQSGKGGGGGSTGGPPSSTP